MVDKVERQVNLVIALLEARRPLTFEELRSKTGYYAQRDPAASRQMFERDKRDLRRLGVPIETEAPGPFDHTDGYIIHRKDYEQPDVPLEPEEAAALAVARRVLDREDAGLSLVRVSARIPEAGGDAPAVPADTTVEVASGPVAAFADPLVHRQTVRFGYRTADGREGQRTVDPYHVAARRGAWYLLGRDHDRDGLRAFRLDRIVGAVTVLSEPGAFVPPDDLDIAGHLTVTGERDASARAAIDPAIVWAAEARGGVLEGTEHPVDGAAWPVVAFSDVDRLRLSGWLAGLGPRVRVLEPPTLRAAVADRLKAVLAAHADPEVGA